MPDDHAAATEDREATLGFTNAVAVLFASLAAILPEVSPSWRAAGLPAWMVGVVFGMLVGLVAHAAVVGPAWCQLLAGLDALRVPPRYPPAAVRAAMLGPGDAPPYVLRVVRRRGDRVDAVLRCGAGERPLRAELALFPVGPRAGGWYVVSVGALDREPEAPLGASYRDAPVSTLRLAGARQGAQLLAADPDASPVRLVARAAGAIVASSVAVPAAWWVLARALRHAAGA